jgi:hypothetical protein
LINIFFIEFKCPSQRVSPGTEIKSPRCARKELFRLRN